MFCGNGNFYAEVNNVKWKKKLYSSFKSWKYHVVLFNLCSYKKNLLKWTQQIVFDVHLTYKFDQQLVNVLTLIKC